MGARLKDKVAIITGAASGIGRGVAELFVSAGAKVIVADMNEEGGKAAVAELGANTRFFKCDVTSEDSVKAMVDFAVSEFGKLDILHNNAGAFGARGAVEEIQVKDFDFTFALLVRSVFLGCKYAAAQMRKQGHGGSIINTASISATTPGYGPHIYQSAKAAVLQLSKTFALELAEQKIRVNCVSPGGVYTPLVGNAIGLDAETVKQVGEGMGATLPMNRPGYPLDIARGVLFFATEDSEFLIGQNMIIDGGESLGKKFKDQGIH
ncbi:MAG TPA: glucose 1-dehydrogenase [Pseudomonadales bacterium]|nr:glucose 1-dehydrogenase [Pseudomonadales bacterium]